MITLEIPQCKLLVFLGSNIIRRRLQILMSITKILLTHKTQTLVLLSKVSRRSWERKKKTEDSGAATSIPNRPINHIEINQTRARMKTMLFWILTHLRNISPLIICWLIQIFSCSSRLIIDQQSINRFSRSMMC